MAKVSVDLQRNSLLKQHQANLIENLSRRIAIAQAHHDANLVALLEKEQRQLNQAWVDQARSHRLFQGLRQFFDNFQNSFKLRVEKVEDASGQTWWYGYDPCTGKTIYGESKADILRWITDNRLG